MKILFFVDIIGRVGREGITTILPSLRQTHDPDFMIANAENAANGKAISPKVAEEIWGQGVDVKDRWNRKEAKPFDEMAQAAEHRNEYA